MIPFASVKGLKTLTRSVGKWVAYYLRNPREIVYPQVDQIYTTQHGIAMRCSHENLIEREIMAHGQFEPETTAAACSHVADAQVVFDIGSNVGYYSLLFCKLVGPTGQVHCFEPTQWAFKRCLDNVALNQRLLTDNLVINKQGLLAEPDEQFGAIESRFSSKILAYRDKESLTFTTLDKYCESHGIKVIDFIKIDVDGYDAQVLRGARKVLSHHRPTMVCELCDRVLKEQDDSLTDYLELLLELGYDETEILDGELRGRHRLAELLNRSAEITSDSVNAVLLGESSPSDS